MENHVLKQKISKLIIPLVAALAILAASYFYVQVRTLRQNPQTIAQAEIADLVEKISRLIVLPTGETPTVATVSDPLALKDQQFFISAQKGDKVLIYTQAKKAILYRPSIDKIIEVAPLNLNDSKNTPTVDTSTPTPISTPVTPPKKK